MEQDYGPHFWREDLMVEFLYKESGKVIYPYVIFEIYTRVAFYISGLENKNKY